jgi:hypothetical protein
MSSKQTKEAKATTYPTQHKNTKTQNTHNGFFQIREALASFTFVLSKDFTFADFQNVYVFVCVFVYGAT